MYEVEGVSGRWRQLVRWYDNGLRVNGQWLMIENPADGVKSQVTSHKLEPREESSEAERHVWIWITRTAGHHVRSE